MDFNGIVIAVVGALIAVAVGFYAGFKKAAKADGVENWKDVVVTEVDELATKIDETKAE